MNKNMNNMMLGYNLIRGCLICVGAIAAEYVFKIIGLPEINIIVNTVAVMAVVWFTNSFIIGTITAVLSMCLFNYLFIEPIYTFAVDDKTYLIMIITMTIVALITSLVAKKAEFESQLAKEKEGETRELYELNNKLIDANDRDDIIKISLKAICEGLWCDASCICFDDKGNPEDKFWQRLYPSGETKLAFELADDEDYSMWPLHGTNQVLGEIRIKKKDVETFNESNKRLLLAMIESTAMALDRYKKEDEKRRTMALAARERYRANLLRAISHDIRTPLTGIIGTSEMLINSLEGGNPESIEFANRIQGSAKWLHSLVENILNLTRLQDDEFKLNKIPEALEEVVATAIGHVLELYPERDVEAVIPEEFIMAPMDAKLIEQVIINLISNAIKHSEIEDQIEVEIYMDKPAKLAWCAVRDGGKGIAKEEFDHIFKSFYTGDASGFGLGLVICETIVDAHGGTIMARNRKDRSGAEFIFSLPLDNNGEESNGQ